MVSFLPRRSKRQTRLTFDPLPSSSPVLAGYDQQLRDRAAAVTYDGSPSSAKRRKIGAEGALLTPRRSSGGRNEGFPTSSRDDDPMSPANSDGEAVTAQRTKGPTSDWVLKARTSRMKAQRLLDFGVMATQSADAEAPSSPSQPRPKPSSSKQSQIRTQETTMRKSQKRRVDSSMRSGIFGINSAASPDLLDESDTSSDTISASSPRSPKKLQGRSRSSVGAPGIRGSETTAGSGSKRRRDGRAEQPKLTVPSPESTSRRTRSSMKKPSYKPSDLSESDQQAVKKSAKGNTTAISLSSNDEESDEMPSSKGSKKPQLRKPVTQKHHRQLVADDSDDLVIVGAKKSRRVDHESRESSAGSDHEQGSGSKHSDQDDDDDDLPRTPGRRQRGGLATSGGRRQTQQELEDLQEDLEFLGSSARPDSQESRRRAANTPKLSARQKALNALKRRRAGQKKSSESPDDKGPSSSRGGALHDTDSEVSQPSDEESELNGELTELSEHAVTRREMFQEDEDDEGFIASDDEGALGAPVDLPLEFSHFSHMKTKELFKFAVEWMVQKKINPAFAISDEVYDLAFRRLDDEVRALAGSKFTSSAWTSEFTRALKARPVIEYHPIGSGLLPDKCDACNRSGHPASWEMKFEGMPYRVDTLEDVSDNESDSDEGDDGSGEIYDANGNVLPNANITYNVGKFCKQNALTAHALAHWRYHLRSWVVDYLKEAGYSSPEKILERDDWSTKRRREYANKIVDKMEQRGEVGRLWRDFRGETNKARNAGQSRWDRSSP